jgi:hypothetical protein
MCRHVPPMLQCFRLEFQLGKLEKEQKGQTVNALTFNPPWPSHLENEKQT